MISAVRAVDHLVVGKAIEIENKQALGDFKKDSGEHSPRPDEAPISLGVRNEFVQDEEDGKTGQEREKPGANVGSCSQRSKICSVQDGQSRSRSKG